MKPIRVLQTAIFAFGIFLGFFGSHKTAHAIYPLGSEVIYYKFEDAATATSTNSGSGGATYNGTFVGAASTTASIRRFGSRSASFGETGDYMRTYYGTTTNPTATTIAVSMWVYKGDNLCNTGDDDHVFGVSGSPTNNRYYIRCRTSTTNKWGYRIQGGTEVFSTTTVSTTNWEHIVLVADATQDKAFYYVNGQAVGAGIAYTSFTLPGDFYVGNFNDVIGLTTNQGAGARIDEVAIYNTPLSASDVNTLYRAGDGIAPIISSVAAGSLTTSGATITWTTDESASTQVEYGLTTSYNASTTLSDTTTYVTSHSANITGLASNTTYHYRVISQDPAGTQSVSSDGTFTTSAGADTTPPVISSVSASVSTSSATITWTTDENSSSQVEYGSTASYGSITTLADTSPQVTSHSVLVTGLTSNTTYHYRVGSTDSSSNNASSSDATFTTSADLPGQPTSLAATGYEGSAYLIWTAATSTVTDYKIEYKLSSDSSWTTFSDGVSTATTSIVTGLSNGSAYNFRVTALNGATEGTVSSTVTATPFYRITFVSPTPSNSSTFTSNYFTASASSTVPSNSFSSSTHTLRLETGSGSLVSQVSTTTRYGDYNLTHLTNTLANSDLSLNVNSSGIEYVGTTGTLFIVHNAAVGSDSTIDEVNTSGTLIRSITCTACGDTEGIRLISSVASTTAGGYDHTFMLSTENNLSGGRIIRVTIHSTGTTAVNATDYFDMSITHSSNLGLEGIAYNRTSGVFYVAREKSTPALFEVTLGSGHSATSNQICTNLDFSTIATDFSEVTYANGILFVLSHENDRLIPVNITSTSSCAFYDSNGNGTSATSIDTADYLNTIPVGATVQPEGVTWDTTGDTLWVLGEADYLAKYRANVFTTQHTFTGLSDGDYVLKSTFYDSNGVTANAATRSFTIDSTAPVISSIASTTDSSSATVTWTTDESSDSKVAYGTSAGTYTVSTSSASLVTNHSIGLIGLSGSTRYYYVVVSKDSLGNTSTSTEKSLTTSSAADVTPPVISSIASTTGVTTATVTWTTDESSDSKVAYGTSAGTYTVSTSSATLVTSHSIGLIGLSGSTRYYYVVVSKDASGNTSTSSEKSLITTAAPDTTPPVISSIASTTGVTTATVTWTTDESSDSKVSYGTSAGTYTVSTSSATLTTSHSVGLTSLSGSTRYYYVVVSKDASGNTSTSTEKTLTTADAPDTTAPVISSIASSTSVTTATVTWTTDESSDSKVAYGTSAGTYTFSTSSASLVTSHSIGLTGLSGSTRYYFVVVSKDASGNTSTSSEKSLLTTAAPDTTGPVISSIASTTAETSATVTWTTDESSDSKVSYGTSAGTYTTSVTSGTLTTSHSLDISGLSASTRYYYVVVSKDASGNTSTSTEKSLNTADPAVDSGAPAISSISSGTPGNTSATITWTTDEQSSSLVVFGPTTAYASTTVVTDTSPYVTSHSVSLSSLVSCTTYYFKVRSADSTGNIATSSGSSFTTSGCPGSATIIAQSSETVDETGGTASLTSSGKGITLDMPASFTTDAVDIQIKKVAKAATISATGNPTADLVAVSDHVYDIKALSGSATSITTFSEPITVSIQYNNGDVSGIDESTLTIYHYSGGSWTELSDCVLDSSANTVECTTTGFSIFGLFGEEDDTPAPSPTPTPTRSPKRHSSYLISNAERARLGLPLIAPIIAQVAAPVAVIATSTTPITPIVTLTKPLYFGVDDAEVRILQKILNSDPATQVAISGAGAPGNETTLFGAKTEVAVQRFQMKYGIVTSFADPGYGFVGPATRKKLNEVLNLNNLTF